MTKSKRYLFTSIHTWNHEIFGAIKDFIHSFQIAPEILLCNRNTTDQIDIAMWRELGKSAHPTSIGVFACTLAAVEFCLDETLPFKAFILVYDDEAQFIDEEEHNDDMAAIGKVA